MTDKKQKIEQMGIDPKEFELPETLYIRDIDNRVFQGIIIQCLSKINGISLIEGNFIDHILGRTEGITGIHTEQDLKNHSINVKVEVNIDYGVSIPEKAEEIQSKIAQELTRLSGLHVAIVHVVFKQLSSAQQNKKPYPPQLTSSLEKSKPKSPLTDDYSDIF